MADSGKNKPDTLAQVTTYKASTKYHKTDKVSIKTDLTLNWRGITLAQLQELATRSAVINWQGEKRASVIPAGAVSINVADYLAKPKGKRGKRDPKRQVTLNMDKLPESEQIALARAMMAKYGL